MMSLILQKCCTYSYCFIDHKSKSENVFLAAPRTSLPSTWTDLINIWSPHKSTNYNDHLLQHRLQCYDQRPSYLTGVVTALVLGDGDELIVQ